MAFSALILCISDKEKGIIAWNLYFFCSERIMRMNARTMSYWDAIEKIEDSGLFRICCNFNDIDAETLVFDTSKNQYIETSIRSLLSTLNDSKKSNPQNIAPSSRGERIIEEYLKRIRCDYRSQYTDPRCKDKRELPFDFAIFSDNSLFGLVEFDGIQHYKPVDKFGGFEGFEKTQYHDKLKTGFCNNNNIPLLRIPYFLENEIEDMLRDFIFGK